VTDSLIELHARALRIARVPELAGLDADTLLALADEVEPVSFEPGTTIGDPGAAFVLPARVVQPGEAIVAEAPTTALRLDADRWLDLLEERAGA
jgi:hypothetical protein